MKMGAAPGETHPPAPPQWQASHARQGVTMPLDCAVPTRKTTAHRSGSRFSVPRGLIAGTLVAAALVWGPYAIIPGSSLLSAQVQTGIYLGLLLLTICSRRAKVLLVRTLQNVATSIFGTDSVQGETVGESSMSPFCFASTDVVRVCWRERREN